MAKYSRVYHVKAALDTAYSPRGLSRMAVDAGISKQLLSFMLAGDRDVTDDVYRRIAEALKCEANRMRETADKTAAIAGMMLLDLKK